MKANKSYSQSTALVLSAVLALTVAPATGSAQSFTIIAPGSAAALTGMTYGEWSAVWWQYVLSKPATDPDNPLLDQTGNGCGADQPRSSPVFFLAGFAGSGAVTRNECTVPAGKVMFFPLLNFVDISAPSGAETPQQLRQELLSSFGPITELHASIDGVPVGNLNPQNTPYRACAGGAPECSSAFSVTLPGNNLFGAAFPGMFLRGKPTFNAGVYSPAVADGFYLMVAPLSPGAHSINFGGSGFSSGSPISQEITYNLVVK